MSGLATQPADRPLDGGAERYPHVFSPVTIGGCELPNRIVRTAHGTSMATGGMITDELIDYHEARARDGVGLTILEIAPVHVSSPTRGIRIWDDAVVPGYGRLLSRLRRYPMKVFQQIAHLGHAAAPVGGLPPLAPSPIRAPRGGAPMRPRAMSAADIEEITHAFADAAARTVAVGLDGVEVHACHGHLIGQFLSPITNCREDGYGGSLEHRMRFVVEVMEAVNARVAGAIAVGIRMSSDELVAGGVGPQDVIAVVRELERRGLVDFVDLSIGSSYAYHRVIGGMDEPHGYQLPTSAPVGRAVASPTIVAGRITTLAEAEEVLASGQADLVSMVRATIADPELLSKSRAGLAHRVRPCIGCNQVCVGSSELEGAHLGCTVNARAGQEGRAALSAVGRRRRVLVAGGGPAGMEAARVAAELGHEVILCESSERLGGQLQLARRLPHREEIGAISDWLAQELGELGVDVRLNTSATRELVGELEPELVIVATGSASRKDGYQAARPWDRTIPGWEQPHVLTTPALLGGELPRGSSAVVLDDVGHYEGVGVAEWLMQHAGMSVTLVTGMPRIAQLMEPARTPGAMKQRLGHLPFHSIVDAAIERIDGASVVVVPAAGGNRVEVAADLVVTVLANDPVRRLADELAHPGAPAVRVVGDAGGPRYLPTAIREAHRAAAALGRCTRTTQSTRRS